MYNIAKKGYVMITPKQFDEAIKQLKQEERLSADFTIIEYNQGRCLGRGSDGDIYWDYSGKAFTVRKRGEPLMGVSVDDEGTPHIVDLLGFVYCHQLNLSIRKTETKSLSIISSPTNIFD